MRPSDDAFAPDPAGFSPTEIPTPAGGEGPRRFRPLSRWQGAVMALLTGAIVIGACSGDNLWTGNSTLAQPKIIGITAPGTVSPGDTILVQVSAYAPRKVASVEVQLAGAAARDTVVNLTTPAVTAVGSARLVLPLFFADTLLVIRAIAYDADGTASRMRSDTATAIAPPAVVGFTGPDSVRAGQVLTLQIHAMGVRPVTKIRVALAQALSAQDSILLAQPGTDVQDTIMFPPPTGTFNDTLLAVNMQAVDNTGMAGPITRGLLPVAITGGPQVDSLSAPDSIRSGTTLDVRVYAHGPRPITTVTLSLRGAYNNDVSVPPTGGARANVTQDFAIPLAASAADSLLVVNAKVTDESGAVSSFFSKTIRISDTAPPTLSANLPKPSVAAGQNLAVHMVATDNVGLATLGVSLLDASKSVLASSTLPVTGRSQDTTVYVTVPVMGPGSLSVVAYALDRFNNQAQSAAMPVTVVDSSIPVNRITAPLDSQTVSVRDSLAVSVTAYSIAGLRTITLSGYAIRQPPNTDPVTVQRYTTRTITFPQAPSTVMPHDTVRITRYLVPLPDTTSELVTIQSIVTDSLGKTSKAQISVIMGGPVLRLLNPANGLQVGIGSDIPVALEASEPTNGLDRVIVTITGGAVPDSIGYLNLGGQRTLFTNPPGTKVTAPATQGTLVFRARAYNTLGFAATVIDTVRVLSGAVADTFAPFVRIAAIDSMRAQAEQRLEETDSVAVTVAAADSGIAGVATMGIAVVARDSLGTLLGSQDIQTAISPATVPTPLTFYFTPAMFAQLAPNLLRLPALVNFEVTAYAIDAGGYCSASNLLTMQRYPCDVTTIAGVHLAQGHNGWSNKLRLVAGRTVVLPQPSVGDTGHVADLAPDTVARWLYVSDIKHNLVQRYNLSTGLFDPNGIRAGSQPWGLDLVQSAGTLIVANSGGTNISRIDVTVPNPQDVSTTRVLTPNLVLEQWHKQNDPTGGVKWVIDPVLDFSDRPQFVAEDSKGRLLYSTVPTPSARDGTIRVVEQDAGWVNSETWLLNQQYGWVSDTLGFAFSNFDGVTATGPGDIVTITYRTPGTDPTIAANLHTVTGSPRQLCDLQPGDNSSIISQLRLAGQTIGYCAQGIWNRGLIGLSDTTFVAIAEDRTHVGFGEGHAATGRIFMWNSTYNLISPDISVEDLVNNASESVSGLALNTNGTFGAARGSQASYFFSPDMPKVGELRLQGEYAPMASGTGGAALHPLHNSAGGPSSTLVSFVGDMDGTRPMIRIIDTFNFADVGRIYLRDKVVGQIKASLPLRGDPQACGPAPAATSTCTFAKLYAITSSGTVVIVDVERRDVNMP